MMEFFVHYWSILLKGILDTLYMVFVSTAFAYILGMPLGVIMVTTAPNGIRPNKPVNDTLGTVINVGRSIPFVILIVAIIPFTRLIVGKAFGSTAAIVPLVIAAAPFVARMVESSLAEINPGVVEAAQTMGATDWQIVWKVLLPESVPSLVRGLSITTITLVGYSAMAGAVGGGGLGAIAINYGYYRFQTDMLYVTVVLMIFLVQIIQMAFNFVAKRIDKRNR